ncbi:MAG: hypothetical protein WC795_00760 [Candidatus Paceibacterota bacterium]|jgi:hypothetical protein
MEKLHQALKKITAHDWYVMAIIVIVSCASFGLGRLSIIEGRREPVTIEDNSNLSSLKGISNNSALTLNAVEPAFATNHLTAKILASKNGKKYYFSWCSGAKNIKEANRVYFSSEGEAEQAGYLKSVTCK